MQPVDSEQLNNKIDANVAHIRNRLGNSADLHIRYFHLQNGDAPAISSALVYFEGMVNEIYLQQAFEDLLQVNLPQIKLDDDISPLHRIIHYLQFNALPVNGVRLIDTNQGAIRSIVQGEVVLFVDGQSSALMMQLNQQSGRTIDEPSTETIIRGPREGFVEDIKKNVVLIRQKLRTEQLRVDSLSVGRITQTKVGILYLEDIADQKIVDEVHHKIKNIDIDGVLESGYIEEFIQDTVYTPFPTVFNTERSDVLVAALLEGRVAILIDGTPFVLIVPAVFVQFFQAAEDYYYRADISSLIRILRFTAFFIALFGPSVYIAITTFHQEMIPAPLLLNLSAQREGVPFPAFVEALLMEIAFEILREAGIRMPRAVGQAVSIVGTLVIGTAAVDAGIVSAAMVIVVSITAISSFAFPAPEMSSTIRIIRFPMMVLAASFGLFGVLIGILLLAFHIVSLRSFGIPYMSPFSPLTLSDLKDTFVRLPIWMMKTRPKLLNKKNQVREQTNKNLKDG